MIIVMKGNNRVSGFRLYKTSADREKAIKMLRRIGRNYFVCFRDTNETHHFGLDFGVAAWVMNGCYINR